RIDHGSLVDGGTSGIYREDYVIVIVEGAARAYGRSIGKLVVRPNGPHGAARRGERGRKAQNRGPTRAAHDRSGREPRPDRGGSRRVGGQIQVEEIARAEYPDRRIDFDRLAETEVRTIDRGDLQPVDRFVRMVGAARTVGARSIERIGRVG